MKQKKVLDGPIASANIKHAKFPFSNLTKGDLVTELRGRGLIEESHKSKHLMEYALTQKLCGVKMVPALLYGNEFKEIRNILPDYEILPVEPCHDIPGHIKNVYTELPHHLNQTEKEILEHAINTSFAKKDTKRSVDYRKSIIIVTTYCRGKICSFAQLLLETLVNIQMLLYAGESKRNQKHIFRLNNQLFLHFMLCKIVIGKTLKVLSFRKFFGSYLHALIPHAGLQIRIVSGMTAFAESEERLFQEAKSITKRTSNNQPGNIMSNIILRSQVEEEFKAHVYGEHGESWLKEQSVVSDMYHEMRLEKNTFIKKEFIRKYPQDWQAYLETVSDFIVLGEGTTWQQNTEGVEFLDSENVAAHAMPPLHHFRAWNLQQEQIYLQEQWRHCIVNPTTIPSQYINVYDKNGDPIQKKILNNLKCLPKIKTTTECEENNDSVPNDNMPTVTDEIQGYKEMTDTTDEMSISTPVDTIQPNTSNESSHNHLHSTLTSSEQLLPKTITMSSINESANNYTQITSSTNMNMSTASPYVKKFKPAVTSTPLSKHVFKTKTAQLLAKLFGENDSLVKDFDNEKLTFNQNMQSEINNNNLLCIIAKLEVKLKNLSDDLNLEYKNWDKKWLINNNLRNPTTEDVRNDVTAKAIKRKMDIITKIKQSFSLT